MTRLAFLPVSLPAYAMILLTVVVSAMAVRRNGWGVLVWCSPFLVTAAVMLWFIVGGPLPGIVLDLGDCVVALFVVTASAMAVRRKGWGVLVWFVAPLMLAADGLWDVFGGSPSKARYRISEGIALMVFVQVLIMGIVASRRAGRSGSC